MALASSLAVIEAFECEGFEITTGLLKPDVIDKLRALGDVLANKNKKVCCRGGPQSQRGFRT